PFPRLRQSGGLLAPRRRMTEPDTHASFRSQSCPLRGISDSMRFIPMRRRLHAGHERRAVGSSGDVSVHPPRNLTRGIPRCPGRATEQPVSVGTATVAMILIGLGSSARRLYL